jgi:hypothetical protein
MAPRDPAAGQLDRRGELVARDPALQRRAVDADKAAYFSLAQQARYRSRERHRIHQIDQRPESTSTTGQQLREHASFCK